MYPSAIALASTLLLSPSQPFEVQVSGSQIWISDPKVVEAQPLANHRALLVGKSAGEAFVYGTRDQSVNRIVITTRANIAGLARCPQSRDLFSATADGSLLAQEWNSDLQNQIRNCGFDRVAVQNTDALAAQIISLQSALAKIDLSPAHAQLQDGRLNWNVTKEKTATLKRSLGELSALSNFNAVTSNLQNTIVFRLDMFEFSKSSAQEIGIDWPTKSSLNATKISNNSALSAAYLKAKQSGRLLASPQLRTIPGKTAEFNSGGEIPIQDAQVFGAKTSWKAYGLKILITPSADSTPLVPEITTTIEIEYSQPDYGNASEGVPSLVTRNLKNQFALNMAQTTLLTSMVQVRRGESSKGIWGLSSIPLLGNLFQSRKQNDDESEIWFLISPTWARTPPTKESSTAWNEYGKLQ